ncbi:MAG: hypothetical protein IPJ74_14265 [Saprospiraceae bacterium]|nr:hypothetical protein [Saprospiraceae bacterium]
MLYAIGEIFLVMVGILLALQINNWNKERQDRKLEHKYIGRLKSELLRNLKTSDNQVLYSEFQIKNANILLTILSKDTLFSNTEPIAVAIEQVGWTYPIRYDSDVWKELNNTGNVALLQNDSLRDLLIDFHSRMLQWVEIDREYQDHVLSFEKLKADVLSPELRHEIANHGHPLRYSGHLDNLPAQAEIIERLKALQGVTGLLTDIAIEAKDNVKIFQAFKTQIEKIIAICDREALAK